MMLPLPERLTSLHVADCGMYAARIEHKTLLHGIGSLLRLTWLHLTGIQVGGGPGLGHLAAGSRLASLHLHHCFMADADFAVLAGLRGFSSLKSLSVVAEFADSWLVDKEQQDNGAKAPQVEPFSASAVRQLAASPWLQGLENLTLRSAGVGDEVAAVLAAAGGLPRLTCLDLSECLRRFRGGGIGDEGARVLAESQSLRALAHLHMCGCDETNVGIRHLAQSTSLVAIKEVWLEGCQTRDIETPRWKAHLEGAGTGSWPPLSVTGPGH